MDLAAQKHIFKHAAVSSLGEESELPASRDSERVLLVLSLFKSMKLTLEISQESNSTFGALFQCKV